MKIIIPSVFGFVLSTTSLFAADVIKPGPDGVFLLNSDNGELKGLETGVHEGIRYINQWKSGSSSATWKIDVPSAGLYTYEITWSSTVPFSSLVAQVNKKKWVDWKIEVTWNWYDFQSKKLKKAFLQQGESELTLTIPIAKSASCINFTNIRLLPASLDKKILELKKTAHLGMSFEDMQLLYGHGMPVGSVDMQKSGVDDPDAELLKGLNSKCKSWRWIPTTDFWIEAAFYDNKCIGFRSRFPNMNMTKALTQASTYLPGFKFSSKGYKKGQEFMTHSSDEEKKYKFQFWGDWFDLKDMEAIREIQNNGAKSEL